jgi:PBP1b-binding outer membrane lipoprotein LpoB
MRFIAVILAALALTGCATGQYQAYADAHKAQAAALSARYQALAEIAKMGDTTAKVAAVISLNAGSAQQSAQIATPKSWADYALQSIGLFLPTIGQVYAVNKQTTLGLRQSDNATALGISTNNAFVGMASQIQAPAPNMTISGSGVIGSGSYSIGANSGTNSGNAGKLAGTSLVDSTSTPTVVRPEVVTNTTTTTNTVGTVP